MKSLQGFIPLIDCRPPIEAGVLNPFIQPSVVQNHSGF
jgi:hypothetical protein